VGCKADHSTPTSADMKNEWIYSPLPTYAFTLRTRTTEATITHKAVLRSAEIWRVCVCVCVCVCVVYVYIIYIYIYMCVYIAMSRPWRDSKPQS
jgi:hypothetical protein